MDRRNALPPIDSHADLKSLLMQEPYFIPHINYLQTFQSQLTPFMRRQIIWWMDDLLERKGFDESLTFHAINLLDRYLCRVQIVSYDLEVVAASCLLLVTKIKSDKKLEADIISEYLDPTIIAEDIIGMEANVISALEWQVTTISSYDFANAVLDQLLQTPRYVNPIKERARKILKICLIDTRFLKLRYSQLALAVVEYVLYEVGYPGVPWFVEQFYGLFNLDANKSRVLMEFIRMTIKGEY
ncbi:G1/S-specific cyclin-D2-like [Aethina tumida]|uniref:G1/S-specific cyclin-D2-like n=1 Tax=Aethina tumida TaxID=116153 RepID=UPI0021497F33|nr:G1/S-specific cyclin-D2-like [Aethina tumida]